MLPWDEMVWPLVGAVIAGGVIGMEREWRGRPAGFRTHILVSLSSCLLMLAALHQAHWAFQDLPRDNIMTDPTRMAHGVLTGIGFLCAGVIVRQGFSIHGLTTAASLWMTSALGLLFGAGLFGLAMIGTVITGLILVALKLVSGRMPSRVTAEISVAWKRGDDATARQVMALLAVPGGHVTTGSHGLSEDGTRQIRCWRMRIDDRKKLDRLSADLVSLPGVIVFQIAPHDE